MPSPPDSRDGDLRRGPREGSTVDGFPAALTVAEAMLAVGRDAAEREAGRIGVVGHRVARNIAQGGTVYAVGAGHALAFAMELCHRAGGLAAFVAMSFEDIRTDKRDTWWQLTDSVPERDPANAAPLLEHHGVTADDCVLIASNSGRNGAIVELAYECRRRGIYTAGFTSVAHSLSVQSRHPSGSRLLEVVDDTVDIHTPVGDAVIDVPAYGRACAASTVAFAVLAQMLNMCVAAELAHYDAAFAFIPSANVGT